MAYHVSVTTSTGRIHYTAIGTNSASVCMDAIDCFGACAVSVRPMGAAQ